MSKIIVLVFMIYAYVLGGPNGWRLFLRLSFIRRRADGVPNNAGKGVGVSVSLRVC